MKLQIRQLQLLNTNKCIILIYIPRSTYAIATRRVRGREVVTTKINKCTVLQFRECENKQRYVLFKHLTVPLPRTIAAHWARANIAEKILV